MAQDNEEDAILLVEDSPSDVFLFQQGLKQHPRKTSLRIAEDGERALRMLLDEGFRPKLIILDVNLPKFSGHEVLHRLKDSPLCQTPIIIFSSVPDPAVPPYADAYIRKPLEIEAYMNIVLKICDEWLGHSA